MKIIDLTTYLEGIAPLHLQESYDNSGLLVGRPETEISGVVVSLDATVEVILEAKEKGCNVVVSHHPIVFSGLKRFNSSNYVQLAIETAIKNDIALYAIHTNLDNVFQNGVNGKICQVLGLTGTEILSPKKDISHLGSHTGSGMIGDLTENMDEPTFLQCIKDRLGAQMVKHTAYLGRNPKRIAVCGGSGRFLLDTAILQGADVFISSDFKYHEYFDANKAILIADIGHFETEQHTIALLYELITQKFSNFATHCTKIRTNPVNYL